MFELKKYREVIFHDKSDVKFEEKLTCGLENAQEQNIFEH